MSVWKVTSLYAWQSYFFINLFFGMYLRWCLGQALNVRRFLSDKLKGLDKLRANRISKLLIREKTNALALHNAPFT